jgi:putative transposase
VLVDFAVAACCNFDMEYQRDELRVHLIVYHLIWCPKRRKPVLVGPVAARCRESLEGKCAEHGWAILALAIQPDRIDLFVRVWPSDSAADVVKESETLPHSCGRF